jgi:membrane-associated phospholipid phosphatase
MEDLMRTKSRFMLLGALACFPTACHDAGTAPVEPGAPSLSAVRFWEDLASVRWNERARTLLAWLPNGSHPPASRILTYLSVAQYRAVLAAESGRDGPVHPSVPAAVGAASAAVLAAFFPAQAGTVQAWLDADGAAPQWPGWNRQNAAAGAAIGNEVAAGVLDLAATDGFGVLSPGVPPVGPGFWVSSPAPIARAFFGMRPWFMTSTDQLRPAPPPAFGSAGFLAGLAEVRAISDTRTAEQLAIAEFWNTATPPFTPGALNAIAADLIVKHHRTEREAARILAFANAAAFDALIACFDAKFAYWFIRPSQADPAITTPLGLPNHPAYPSAHACLTGAALHVVAAALPGERRALEAIIAEAGMSRVYAGIHYRFDVTAGHEIGRRAAQLALAGSLQ